jgi:hypothetical protein
VTQLVQLYANTEDLTSAQAANLEADMSNSFANAYGYFNTLGTDSQSPNIKPQSLRSRKQTASGCARER